MISLRAFLKAIIAIIGLVAGLFFIFILLDRPYPTKFPLNSCVQDTQVHRTYKITHLPSRLSIFDDCRKGKILIVGDVINNVYRVGETECLLSNDYLELVACP